MKSLLILLGLTLSIVAFSQTSTKTTDLTAKIAQEPSNPALYFARADAYDQLNNFEQANRDYMKVINLYSGKPNAQHKEVFAKSCYRLADEYFFRQANPQKAAAYVDQGIKAAPENKDLEILDAILAGLDPNKRDIAAAKYVMATGKYPDDVRLNLYYGKFLLQTDPLAAAARFEKALAADPLNEEALLSLGTLYNNEATAISGEGKDPDTAFEYATKASTYFERLYKMHPDNKEYTNILLRLYEELDQQDKAAMLRGPY